MRGNRAMVGMVLTAIALVAVAWMGQAGAAGPIPGGVGPPVFVTDPITGIAQKVDVAGRAQVNAVPGIDRGTHFQRTGSSSGSDVVVGPLLNNEQIAITSFTFTNPTTHSLTPAIYAFKVGAQGCSAPPEFDIVFIGEVPAGEQIHVTFPEPLLVPSKPFKGGASWCLFVEAGGAATPTPGMTIVGRYMTVT